MPDTANRLKLGTGKLKYEAGSMMKLQPSAKKVGAVYYKSIALVLEKNIETNIIIVPGFFNFRNVLQC